MSIARPEAAVVFGRVSSLLQEKEDTIASQMAALRDYAATHSIAVVDEYVDNGYSGDTLVRPELDRLRDDAKTGPFSLVLMTEPTRLARRYVYKELVEDDLRAAGVSVLYINRPLGDTPEDRLLGGMQGLLAEYERAKILDRTRRGMRYKVSQGHIWRSRRNYGYRYVPPARGELHGHMEIVESEAAIVRLIFGWILAGKSAIWVADELNHRGIPALRGGRWWDTTMGGIIRNPIYSGHATFDRYAPCEPTRPKTTYRKRRKSSHRQRPESEWMLISVPATITPEEHADAKAALSRNKSRSKRNTKEFYLLAGLLRCGYENRETGETCGLTLGCHVQRRVRPEIAREHRCTRAYVSDGHKRTRCQNRIRAHEIEPLVWEYLVTRLQRQDILDEQMQEAQAGVSGEVERIERELAAFGACVETAQAKLDALLDMALTAGKTLDRTTFERRQAALIAERTAAEDQVRDARARLEAARKGVTRWATARAFCAQIAQELEELNKPEAAERRRVLLQTLLTDVVVYPTRIRLYGAIPCADGDVPRSGGPGGGPGGRLSTHDARVERALVDNGRGDHVVLGVEQDRAQHSGRRAGLAAGACPARARP